MNIPEGAIVIFRDPNTGTLRVGISPFLQFWSTGGGISLQVEGLTPTLLYVTTVVRIL